MSSSIEVHYGFPHDYDVKVLKSYSLLNPSEKLYQFPALLEEGDRTGIYLRVAPQAARTWIGFFAQGFESTEMANGIFSCPDSGSVCAVIGGYAYVVQAADPQQWVQIEQRPVVEVRSAPELSLLLFVGFSSITGLGVSKRLWTTERLSWEGLSVLEICGAKLHGTGWDMIADKEVPFEVDLITGESKGGAKPQRT